MLLIAIGVICAAHIVRILRWELFIKSYENPDRKNLIESLSIGYLLNFFLPYKLGDLVRVGISGKKMKNGIGFSMATVIIDRYLDVVTVGVLFVAFSVVNMWQEDNVTSSRLFYMVLAAVIMIITVVVWVCRKWIKKIVRFAAALFNDRIEFEILKFFWALIWSFVDIFKKISKIRLALYTVVMWFLYLISYYCFAVFLTNQGLEKNLLDVFYMLFAKNSIRVGSFGLVSDIQIDIQSIWNNIYLLGSTLVLLIISLCDKKKVVEKEDNYYLNLIPHLDNTEKLNFLELYFSSEQSSYVQNYLKINQNILIIRDYSAGSNATTMLCMNDSRNFFRKYAFGEDGDKLYQQVEWLRKYKNDIPLPEIMKCEKEHEYCYYDMPYNSNAVGLFDYAHSMPREKAWLFIQKATECLEHTIYKINVRPADKETIHKYINAKVNQNLDKIMNAKYLKNLMEYEFVFINGKRYNNLPHYLKYLNEEHLSQVFGYDTYSEIHGDLTIENIICTRDTNGNDDFYIIDPNTGNVHDSSNLDYAKLLQSIHGGYEFLMAIQNVKVDKNYINFIFAKSEIYTYLYEMLDAYMYNNFSTERIKSIYYHEIIHWLRLMPYKIDKNGKRVLLFYAGMIMVMNDIIMKFEEDENER